MVLVRDGKMEAVGPDLAIPEAAISASTAAANG